MVLVILGSLQFEASKFETRTMPTPDLKGKEIIYWIKVETSDKRLAVDLHRFLKGAPNVIELKVPSAFIVANTELETFWPQVLDIADQRNNTAKQEHPVDETGKTTSTDKIVVARPTAPESRSRRRSGEAVTELNENQLGETKRYAVEIVLRRALPSQGTRQSQSPYG